MLLSDFLFLLIARYTHIRTMCNLVNTKLEESEKCVSYETHSYAYILNMPAISNAHVIPNGYMQCLIGVAGCIACRHA